MVTVSESRVMTRGVSAPSRVRIDRCVSAVRAVEVPLFLRARSYSNDTSVASMWVRCRQVTPGVLDDLCCLPDVATAGGWVKVDTWPLLSRD